MGHSITFTAERHKTEHNTMRNDKFIKVPEIWGDYGQGWEFVTGAKNYAEARRLLSEYRENQPEYRHWIKWAREPNPDYVPTAFERIICKVDTSRGAPMGRASVLLPGDGKKHETIFDRRVPLDSGGYDRGGAYWGIGGELRVRYTKSLSLIQFYRR